MTSPPTGTGTAPPPPRCQGDPCENRDPMDMICGFGPHTLTEHRTDSGARLQLRYSRGCGASWARVRGTRVGDRVELTVAGPTRSAEILDTLRREGVHLHPDDENPSRHDRTGLLPPCGTARPGVLRGHRAPSYAPSFWATSVAQ
ncbi:DUF2690 domain-containing protein [Streptomyces sp. TE5632]